MTVPLHGSEAGYLNGCRSRGGCQHARSAEFYTCVEAYTARRGDYSLARRHPAERLRRDLADLAHLPVAQTPRNHVPCDSERPNAPQGTRRRQSRSDTSRHGTTTGYLRGCRSDDACPKGQGGVSCNEARNGARRRRARQLGVPPRPRATDASLAVAKIVELRAAGLSLRQIARSAQVGHTTVTNIARGDTTSVWPETLQRIVAIAASIPDVKKSA